jgi:DNA-binding transcriptional LysR family regulator
LLSTRETIVGMDQFREMTLFVQVADTGSLTHAATVLNMSNAAASRLLSSLESRLSVRLVERNTRRLFLTTEGQDFLLRAKAILGDLAEAEATAKAASMNPTGVLKVSASLSFAMHQIAPRLAAYHALYPKIKVHIETSNRYLDLIEHGIDVAIRTREFEPDSNITIRRLSQTRRVLAASPGYLAKQGIPREPLDLQRHNMLLYVYANTPYELRFVGRDRAEHVEVSGVLESNDGQVLRAAALQDHGILIQPSYILYEDIVAGRLVPVLGDWELPRLQINLAYASRKHLSAKVRSFIDFMVNEFQVNDYERKWTGQYGKNAVDTSQQSINKPT